MSESSSSRLRAATAVLHQRVEDGMDIEQRTASLTGYVDLLGRLEAFYGALEPALNLRVPSGLWANRLDRLHEDLDLLEPSWRPRSRPDVPLLEGDAFALGALYVVEGAALGGRIITRHLEERHGLSAYHGAAFFASGGEAIGPRWRRVKDTLDEVEEFPALEAGAVATFLAFERAVVAPHPQLLSQGAERGEELAIA